MDSLRTTALQRELTRIENEAREHSLAAMNVADALEAAEQLCVLINAGLDSEQGVEPSVLYLGGRNTEVLIYPSYRSVEVMQRLEAIELEWTNNGAHGSEEYKKIGVAGFEGVSLIVSHNDLAHYLAGRIIEKAAA